jgi:hypothetical protein
MANVQPCLDGEKYTRKTTIVDLDKRLLTVSHVTQVKDGKVWMEHEVDLSEMSDEDILKHACNDIIIKYRGRSFKQWLIDECINRITNGFVFRPEDYPKSESGATPEQRAKGGFNTMCDKATSRKELVESIRAVTMVSKKLAETLATERRPDLT